MEQIFLGMSLIIQKGPAAADAEVISFIGLLDRTLPAPAIL